MILKSMVPVSGYPRGLHQPTNCGHEAPTVQEIIVVDDGSEPPLQQLFQNDEKRLDQDPIHDDGRNSLGFFKFALALKLSMRFKCYPGIPECYV